MDTGQTTFGAFRVGLYLAFCALTFAGCVDPSMQDAVGPLVGQNVRIVYERWGPPAISAPAFGSIVNTWQIEDTNNGSCTVDLFVTPDGIIKSWDWRGVQRGTCSAMAAQLRTGIGFVDHQDLR